MCLGLEFWTKLGFYGPNMLFPDIPGKMASPEDPGKSGSDCTLTDALHEFLEKLLIL